MLMMNLDALGIVVTSAASQTLGSALWQPYLLLRAIQKYQYVMIKHSTGDFPFSIPYHTGPGTKKKKKNADPFSFSLPSNNSPRSRAAM